MQSTNPSHQEFFAQAFTKAEYRITKQSIYTRIQSLLNHRIFYHLINGKSTVNLANTINKKKVLILNLSQGKMGAEMSSVYGKFIIAQLTSIALKRSYIPKFARTPTYLFIDEFQNYLTSSIEKILGETRKYGLHLVVANQSLAQITNKKLKEIILSNASVKIVGSNSPTTLSVFAREMAMKIEPLQKLQKFQFYVQIGRKRPFLIKTNQHLNNWSYQLPPNQRKELKQFFLNGKYYKDTPKEPLKHYTYKDNDKQ